MAAAQSEAADRCFATPGSAARHHSRGFLSDLRAQARLGQYQASNERLRASGGQRRRSQTHFDSGVTEAFKPLGRTATQLSVSIAHPGEHVKNRIPESELCE
jgi:hypothetical protein